MQLDRGSPSLRPLSLTSSPRDISPRHPATHSGMCCVHGHAMRPSETNPHKARAATSPDRQLMGFSPFFFLLLVLCTRPPGAQFFNMLGHGPPDLETRSMVFLTRATLLCMRIMRGGVLDMQRVKGYRRRQPSVPQWHYRSNVYTLGISKILLGRPGLKLLS